MMGSKSYEEEVSGPTIVFNPSLIIPRRLIVNVRIHDGFLRKVALRHIVIF